MWSTEQTMQTAAGDAVRRMRASLAALADEAPGPRESQELLAAAIQLHVALCRVGERFSAFTDADGVTATDVVVTASHLLEAADVEIFELQLWDIWGLK
jgi:hypothetical protein